MIRYKLLLLFISLVWGQDFIGFKANNEIYYKINPKTGMRFEENDKGFLGIYHRLPIENEWHIGEIVAEGDHFRWINEANVSWKLYLDQQNNILKIGTDNPYYEMSRNKGWDLNFYLIRPVLVENATLKVSGIEPIHFNGYYQLTDKTFGERPVFTNSEGNYLFFWEERHWWVIQEKEPNDEWSAWVYGEGDAWDPTNLYWGETGYTVKVEWVGKDLSRKWMIKTLNKRRGKLKGDSYAFQSEQELQYLYKNLPEFKVAVYPNVIFEGETFKIITKQNSFPHCELYDNGTHGDDIAGDGLFSRSGVSTDDLVDFNSRQIFSNKVTKFQFSNAELLVINSELRGTVQYEDFGDGLIGTKYALFYALGDEYNYVYQKRNWELHNPNNSIAGMRVLIEFGDVFDHLVFVPDVPFSGASYVRIRDDVQGIMTYGDPICGTGMWTDNWKKPNDYKYENVDFGCPYKFLGGNDYPRLKGNIWNGSSGMNELNHEFGHWMGIGPSKADFPGKGLSWNSQDRMHINSTSTVSNVMTGPLWDPKKGWPNSVRVKDENGIWKEVQIESNNDGTFTMVPRNPMKNEGYDDILLYMLGFKSPEEANKRYYLFDEKDINLDDCFYQDDSKGEPLNATAGSAGLYCYDNIIDQSEYGHIVEFGVQEMIDIFGPRVPSYEDAPKHLNVGVIILTQDIASEATRAWYHLLYGWWANENEWHDELGGTWSFVTRGLATIRTGIPK